MITRDQALTLIRSRVNNQNIIRHMLALASVMAALYDTLHPTDGSTKEQWYMAGLLHDGDYSAEVPDHLQGIKIVEWARAEGFEIPENVAHAMAAHNWNNTGVEPVNQMDWSIFCADSLTGLIVASTLVLPSKRISDLSVGSVMKKFPQKSFASGTRREDILMCESKLNLLPEQFVSIALQAMQSVSEEIGL